jgi:hypothetical protein
MNGWFKSEKIERTALWMGFFLLILYLSPLYLLGENAHIRVHDNLDSNIAWYRVLVRSGELFGPIDAVVPQIINGLPRNAFGTEFSGIVWLHALLPSMTAYSISQTITRIVAFIGMYLLLKRHFVKEEDAYWIRVGVALAFAITPVWPSGMLSTLGQPLALWAFLNIREGKYSWREWVVLALLPFYSSFVLGFFFFLVAMGLLWLWDWIAHKKWNLVFLGSIAFMSGIFLLIEYRLVLSLIFGEEPTSRNEFWSSRLALPRTIRLVFKNYFLGHNHVMTVHSPFITVMLFFAFTAVLGLHLWKKEKRFLFLFVLNFVLSVWYAFWFYKGWQPLKEKVSLFNTFNFARFHFLRPLVIYVSFALALSILTRLSKEWKSLAMAFLGMQIMLLVTFNEEIRYRSLGAPSFKQFYSEHLFGEIRDYIGKPQSSYRVASIGLHPAIAQYNGFYTLDTYNNFYPLTYKHQFRKIIAKELEKNKVLQDYYDHWGNRVYLYSAELGKHYDFRKHSRKKIHHLELNTTILKQMGGRYIFSSVPILNAEENRLRLLKSFEDQQSVWKIYVYQVE